LSLLRGWCVVYVGDASVFSSRLFLRILIIVDFGGEGAAVVKLGVTLLYVKTVRDLNHGF
jgi:hypothetical protein